MRRRTFISALGTASVAGCLGNGSPSSEDGTAENGTTSGTEATTTKSQGEHGLPPCEGSENVIKVLNASIDVQSRSRPVDGDVELVPHPVIKGTIRNISAKALGIDVRATLFANGNALESEAVAVNEGGQYVYYELDGGEQTAFTIETDTDKEPERFELTVRTLEASLAETADTTEWLNAEKNGCV